MRWPEEMQRANTLVDGIVNSKWSSQRQSQHKNIMQSAPMPFVRRYKAAKPRKRSGTGTTKRTINPDAIDNSINPIGTTTDNAENSTGPANTSTDTQTNDFRMLMAGICHRHAIVLSPAAAGRFNSFYDDVILGLEYRDENVIRIYMHAFIYVYMKVVASKKSFADGCSLKVFDRAIKQVKEWLRMQEMKPAVAKDGGYRPTCNLYSIMGGN